MVIFENSQCVSSTNLYRRVDVSAFTELESRNLALTLDRVENSKPQK